MTSSSHSSKATRVHDKLLLDTHVALWVAASPQRIGRKATNGILAASDVAISSISIAEMGIKAMLGKLKKPDDLVQRLLDAGYSMMDFSVVAAAEVERFGTLVRHDPFDRLILAQASASGYSLVTADSTLLAQGFDFVIDAGE